MDSNSTEAHISRRTTIIDVAKMSGVSPKTVSRALNDEPHVSARVRQLVKDAAAKLDYHPNLTAQSLIARRSFLIGLTYERPSPSYVVDLQNGALDRMHNGRYRLVVLPFNHASERPEELGKLLLRTGLDGVLLAPPACDQIELLDLLDRQGLPYARITPQKDLARGIVITMDEVAAGQAVASHVLDMGHSRVGVILGDPAHAASLARLEGYRRAFAAHGKVLDDNLIVTGDFTYAVGYDAALDLLRRDPAPTAILAQNDDMAAAALAAARAVGLGVPDDLSIAGFDDSEVSRTAWPQLTTVHQPVSAMAWDAADRLIARLDATPDGPTLDQRHDHAHALLVRGSTAPPPVR